MCVDTAKSQENNYIQIQRKNFFHSNKSYLKQEFEDTRVVALGDVTHGEGSVMEMNIELIKFLHEEMGFNTIAFESGIYDVYKAQKVIEASGDVGEAIRNSIFSIWTNTCEFQELIKYISENKLKIVGFDYQLTGEYSTYESVDDLQALLRMYGLNAGIDFELIENVFISFGEYFSFPKKTVDYNQFQTELDKINKQLQYLKSRNVKDIDLWLQFLKSTEKLAKDYYENNPSSYSQEEFKAPMSNPRDAQMADNLLFYLKKNPEAKVVCWGASAHFANDLTTTRNSELEQYRPMGSYLKKELGPSFCAVAPIIASGTHGVFEPTDTIKNLTKKSIESQLNQNDSFYQFIDLNSEKYQTPFVSYAIEYTPFKAKWNDVFDAFIFLKGTQSTTLVKDECRFHSETEVNNKANSSQKSSNPVLTFSYEKIKGRLTDEKREPIPFCNVLINGTTIGTISNEDGFYEINFPKKLIVDTLIFSCVGYERREIAMNNIQKTTTLESRDFVLDEIKIEAKSLDPVSILRKAIDSIPQNYIQKDYNAEMYSRGIYTSHDSIKFDMENVVKIYDKNGYDNKKNLTSRRIAFKLNKTSKYIYSNAADAAFSSIYLKHMDLVSQSPLFKKRFLKKYHLKLLGTTEHNHEKVYKIAFDSKFKAHRYTGYWYINKFNGVIYINSKDYSIVKTDAYWEYNLDIVNKIPNSGSKTVDLICDNEFIKLSATYKKYQNKYFFNYGSYIRYQKGKSLKSNKCFELKGIQTIFTSKIELENIDIIPDKQFISSKSRKLKKDDKFWSTYNKPVKNE